MLCWVLMENQFVIKNVVSVIMIFLEQNSEIIDEGDENLSELIPDVIPEEKKPLIHPTETEDDWDEDDEDDFSAKRIC